MRKKEEVPIIEKSLQANFLCAGNRTYLIGSQDGLFPEMGSHIEGEHGGLWNHPIKLLDGFWLKIKDLDSGVGEWLVRADKFINGAFYITHKYSLRSLELGIVRRQFCPDDKEALIVYFDIHNLSSTKRKLEISLLFRSNLRPIWKSEEMGIVDGDDEAEFRKREGILVAKDKSNPWYLIVGSSDQPKTTKIDRDLWGPETTRGKGMSGQLTYDLTVKGRVKKTLKFIFAGSYNSEKEAKETFQDVLNHDEKLYLEKGRRYLDLTKRSELSIPNEIVQEAFTWIKLNYDMLNRKVPGLGEGLGAGMPTYPWWFGCDNNYAVLGLLPIGQFELAKKTLRTLAHFSEIHNKNGRIPHEVVANNFMYNAGNTQETPQFTRTVYQTFLWTGDREFLKEVYPICKKGVLNWLLEEMDSDKDILPEGYGITEIADLNMELLDTAIYTYEALRAISKMAGILGEKEIAKISSSRAEELKRKIEGHFWLENEGVYADVIASPSRMRKVLEKWISRLKEEDSFTWNFRLESAGDNCQTIQYLTELEEKENLSPSKEYPWLLKNWIIAVPMETGFAPPDRAIRSLERLETDEFTHRWGLYVCGLEKPFIMSISTGVMAVAECSYDRVDKGLEYIQKICKTLHLDMPGAISEGSPDLGCFVQAWSGYGVIWPLMTQILGLQPTAHEQKLVIRPRLPQGWGRFSLKNLKIGDNTFSLDFQVHKNKIELKIKSSLGGWDLMLDLPKESEKKPVFTLNGKRLPSSAIQLSDITMKISWKSCEEDVVEIQDL